MDKVSISQLKRLTHFETGFRFRANLKYEAANFDIKNASEWHRIKRYQNSKTSRPCLLDKAIVFPWECAYWRSDIQP